jgi:MOSC domain-containing protein YiiM
MEGRIYQVNIKPRTPGRRGLPKSPVISARIRKDGLEGDYNRYRSERLGGDPDQAVLLYPAEIIRRLNEEGWPVRAGDLGENITTEGLADDAFIRGSIYQVGEAILEVTKPCDPCRNLSVLPYVGNERKKEFIRALVNRRGWYARVLKEGSVRAGDRVERVNEAVAGRTVRELSHK